MKKTQIEQITSSFILFAISTLTILPFLFKVTPEFVDDEKEFKQLLQNLTNNVEFHAKQNILPALFFYPLSFDEEVSNFLESNVNILSSSRFTFFRSIPAIFSSFVAPIFFNFLCNEGTSLRTAFILSLMIPLDSSYIIRSRLFLPDCFIYFFSVVSLYFFSISISCSSLLCFIISTFCLSITFLCDHQGLYIISYIFFILVDLVLEEKITFKNFFIKVIHLFLNLIFCSVFIAIMHIGLQSGPSDIQPFKQRFLSEIADMISLSHDFEAAFESNFSFISKLSYPNITNIMKIKPNYSMILLFVSGIICSIILKRPNSVIHFLLAFISSFFYSGPMINHLQIMTIFGLISAVPFIDQILKNNSKHFSYLLMVASIIYYLLSFQSNYGGKLSFTVTEHEL